MGNPHDRGSVSSGLVALRVLVTSIGLMTSGCGGENGDGDGDGSGEAPDHYDFESRFSPGESSVHYSGQTLRQTLIASMTREIDAVQADIDRGVVFEEGDVAARLLFYYQFDSTSSGGLTHGITTMPGALQSTFDDISADKDLQGKFAGNDEIGQHKDWNSEFVGWGDQSPEALLLAWVDELDALAVAYSAGTIPTDPVGSQIDRFYVSADGLDYQQLLQKLLLGAINYSQGTDDYMDDDVEGKGLRSDHEKAEEGASHSTLEHAWDEGFGYWGGARDYVDHSDDEIADVGYHDTNMDGAIDLTSEYSFGASVNAAKRDRGSAAAAPTDFSEDTMRAFLEGRWLITRAQGSLSDDDLAALRQARDDAVKGWEDALAATAVHYFNETIRDMSAEPYEFASHAKHWSELKGFLLTLQFNPRKQISDAELADVHELVGTAPVFHNAPEADDYVTDLLDARTIVGQAYGFADDNLGDDKGENGW